MLYLYRKSKITYGLALLGLTLLTPGFSRANDLDDAERELNQARERASWK